MRLAVTEVQMANGKCDTLFHSDVDIDTQKRYRKKLIASFGKDGKKQYSRLVLFSTTGEVKRSRFDGPKTIEGEKDE